MTASADRPVSRKTVLFCPVCGHQSPVDGDWHVDEPRRGNQRRVYECPECGETIASQPVFCAPA